MQDILQNYPTCFGCKNLVKDGPYAPISNEQILVDSMVVNVINDNQSYVVLDGHTVEIVQTIEQDADG